MKANLLKRILFLFFITILLQTYLTASSINFIQADYNSVTQLSSLENKHFFVNYSADWCATCKVMEETSNANPTLVNFIDEKFIAVKANVDNAQGKLWQAEYGVTCLPTLIVFSPEGKEVARKNGGITSSEFLIFLQQFETMPSPSFAENVEPQNHISNLEISSINSFSNSIKDSELKPKGSSELSPTIHSPISKNFGVQVGMYSNLKNANRKIDRLKKLVSQPVMLRFEKVKEQTMYQVILGEYSFERDATIYINTLKSKGIKGYVIEL